MSAQKHRVKRVLFELSIEQETQARWLHAEVGRVHRDCVLPLLDNCLSDLAGMDELIRIDLVELDLGSIQTDNFEEDLVGQLRHQLTNALQRGAAAARLRRGGNGEAAGQLSRLELFVTFAKTGCLPWWADPSGPELLSGVVDDLIDRSPESLRRHLPDLLSGSRSLERIVRCFDQTRLSRIAALMSRLDASVIDRIAGELIRLIAEDASGPGSAGRSERAYRGGVAVRHLAWGSILASAGRHLGRDLDSQGFWREVLIQVAARSGTSYAALISTLYQSAGAGVGPRTAQAMQRIVNSLYRQISASGAGSGATSAAGEANGGVAASRSPRADGAFGQAEAAGAAASGYGWPEVLRLLSQPTASARGKDQDRLRKIAGDLLAAGVPPPPELRRRLPALEDALRDHLEPSAMAALHRMLQGAPRERTDPTVVAQKPEHTFAESEEAYVENAGLVILWPFLERFFRQLDLLNDTRFKDPAAASRAAGLLQYLVTEDPFGPEYLLPLNKVLCGLEPADVFEFEDPLSDIELEESGRLLEAAIGHAPILRNMSVTGFRGSFLSRKGVLTARDGAWILRVERESFDLVLNRFPWSFDWIKLPWMPEALRVEW